MNRTSTHELSIPAPSRPPSPPLPYWSRVIGQRRRQRRAGDRRGVLLLLMLCLLVLFAVLGVTYVLLGSQFRRSTSVQPRLEQYASDYRNQLDEAAMQVFRGSSSALSVLSNQSLLEDMYGNDAISSASTAPATSLPTGITIYSAASSFVNTTPGQPEQLIDLTLQTITGSGGSATLNSNPLPWPLASYYSGGASTTATQPLTGNPPYYNSSPPPNFVFTQNSVAPSGFFNGCILTFTSGPAAGQSTRIVGYDNGLGVHTTGVPTLRVVNFPGANALVTASYNNSMSGGTPKPSVGAQFVINGRPFNGTGFGFNANPVAGQFGLVNATDGTENSNLFALLPNPVTFSNGSVTGVPYPLAGGIGGADEDYDAADWNNLLLGLSRDPRDAGATTLAYPNLPYPSLHRPELVHYWINKPSVGATSWATLLAKGAATPGNGLQLARQIVMRPIGYVPPPSGITTPIVVDHPNFTGGNPNPNGFDPINGPLDVDNDGDGIADSIWVDLGERVQTAPDGTAYKPLYAIRVLDMDGRLNVNAHGSSAQAESTFASGVNGYFNTTAAPLGTAPLTPATVTPTLNSLTLNTAATATPNAQYPTVGSGYGTAEINLLPLFAQQTTALAHINAQQKQYGFLLGGNTTTTSGSTTPPYEGRYGESTNFSTHLPYTDAQAFTTNTTASAYPVTFPPQAGVTNLTNTVLDYANSGLNSPTGNPLAFIKFWDYPMPGYPAAMTSFGSPADLWGRGLIALDINGTPVAPYMSNQPYVSSPTGGTYTIAGTPVTGTNPGSPANPGGQYDTLNNPYTLNLSHNAMRGAKQTGATDNPFTPAELERLLRAYDADSGALPPALAGLLDATTPAPPYNTVPGVDATMQNLRKQVTTDSFDLPSPSITSITDLRAGATPLPLALSPVDLLTARLINGGVTAANLPTQVALMLPPELLNGQRFDINRPLGNGRDDDGDHVVDEPDEYHLGEQAWLMNNSATSPPWSAIGGTPSATPFPSEETSSGSGTTYNSVNLAIDWNGNNTIDSNDAQMARHMMARYLYVLAMTLVDQKLIPPPPTAPATPSLLYDTDAANTQYQVQYALAQWAINAVDFRDRDSIMTPFEFDVNPFNGWQVDGDITTPTDNDTAFPHQTIVWGAERPELLISETLAWHDRRTQDLAAGGGKVPPAAPPNDTNNDFDQQLVPMPACFVELYNPWTSQTTTLNSGVPSQAEVSGEFYHTAAGNGGGVILNSTVTDPTSHLTYPVWRLIFVKNLALLTADPDDPYPLNPNPFTQASIDRTVYFAQPTGAVPEKTAGTLTYFSSQPVATVKPGRYAVVGSSGENTGIAGVPYGSKIGRPTGATVRQIGLAPSANTETNQVTVINNGQSPTEPTPISAGGTDAQPAIAVAVDTAVTAWGAANAPPTAALRSFGITDPNTTAGYFPTGFAVGPPTAYNEATYLSTQIQPVDNPGAVTPIPGVDARMLTDTTYTGYCTVHLQRLANPQVGYNAATNPYRTIDSASIDVTTFNGVQTPTTTTDPSWPPLTRYRFCSTQRGDQYATGGAAVAQVGQYSALWAHEPTHATGSGVLIQPLGSDPVSTGQIFNLVLRHSIGYLNQQYGVSQPGGTTPYTAASGTAYSNSNTPKAPAAVYTGMPTNPFPWLTWNNRPYVTPMELTLVPKSRSSRLAFDYSLTTSPPPPTASPNALYNTQSVPGTASYFGHLINFFDAGTTARPNPVNLYRLLEYVQVPSKFVGTDAILDPTYYTALAANRLNGEPAPGSATGTLVNSPYATTNLPYTNGTSAFGSYFRPPFNKVSEYRDPGRVNINTVQEPVVWQGVLNGASTPQLQMHAGASPASVSATLNMNSAAATPPFSPSYFPNPFRSFGGAALTNSIYGPASTYANATRVIPNALHDIDATLLRPAFNTTNNSWNQAMALFDAPSIASGTNTMYPYNDPTRSPYFRLQNASRMSNLLTTRSNVYAVWITVGYFQVTPWYGPPTGGGTTYPTSGTIIYDTAHQDGYQLGQELGSDSGQIKRHRAFYLFDRTIPVGFERGVDHNVQNAILLRRFIE